MRCLLNRGNEDLNVSTMERKLSLSIRKKSERLLINGLPLFGTVLLIWGIR